MDQIIHLAFQSQVRETQHFSVGEKRREGGRRGGEEVFSVVWFLNVALFFSSPALLTTRVLQCCSCNVNLAVRVLCVQGYLGRTKWPPDAKV